MDRVDETPADELTQEQARTLRDQSVLVIRAYLESDAKSLELDRLLSYRAEVALKVLDFVTG